MTRKQVMQQLVKEEAKNLKKNATQEEIAKLNFSDLVPTDSEKCIYGQLTGCCWNGRAIELIKKSCKRVYTPNYDEDKDTLADAKVNGKPKEDRDAYWSPIEVFIYQDKNTENGNNKKLIDYIKGKTETLEFV